MALLIGWAHVRAPKRGLRMVLHVDGSKEGRSLWKISRCQVPSHQYRFRSAFVIRKHRWYASLLLIRGEIGTQLPRTVMFEGARIKRQQPRRDEKEAYCIWIHHIAMYCSMAYVAATTDRKYNCRLQCDRIHSQKVRDRLAFPLCHAHRKVNSR